MSVVRSMLDNIKEEVKNAETNVIKEILHKSRQNDIGDLSPMFTELLQSKFTTPLKISFGMKDLHYETLIENVISLINDIGINKIVIGLSGGADSSVAFALYNEVKNRNKNVEIYPYYIKVVSDHGYQNVKMLGEHYGVDIPVVDLTDVYDTYMNNSAINESPLRQGNLRARLRMTFLYEKAHEYGAVVAGNSNFSEFAAGFWTINGDVGDINVLEGLFKSTEIPKLGEYLNLPEKFWRETPSDGLDITSTNTDEEQIGMSYLEWDILCCLYMTVSSNALMTTGSDDEDGKLKIDIDFFTDLFKNTINVKPSKEDIDKMNLFFERIEKTRYKRVGPISLDSGNKIGVASMIEM